MIKLSTDNSEEHIFRVLLRIKHTTEKYAKICNYIFMYVDILLYITYYEKYITGYLIDFLEIIKTVCFIIQEKF